MKRIKHSKKTFYVSSFTLHSIEVIMIRNKQEKALFDFLSFINKGKIIRIDTVTTDELTAIESMKEFQFDFDDSVQLVICRKYNLDIVSYDKHFDKTSVKRIEPSEVSL